MARNHRVLGCLVAVAALLSGCANDTSGEDAGTTVTVTETTTEKSSPAHTDEAGLPVQPGTSDWMTVGQRDYKLWVPQNYSADKQWPVILAASSFGQSPDQLESDSGLNQAEALVVYAQGVDGAWAPAPYATTTMADEVHYANDIVNQLDGAFSIDRGRVFSVGFASGAGFAAGIACRQPGLIAGVATLSAAFFTPVHDECSDKPIAMIDFHGTADDVVGYYSRSGIDTAYPDVDTTLKAAAKRNKCHVPIRLNMEDTPDVEALRSTWSDCAKPLAHVRVKGGGHKWPGQFATADILEFFDIPMQTT